MNPINLLLYGLGILGNRQLNEDVEFNSLGIVNILVNFAIIWSDHHPLRKFGIVLKKGIILFLAIVKMYPDSHYKIVFAVKNLA